jgi:pimeloyl-ACP methyl ester carboxylesterase
VSDISMKTSASAASGTAPHAPTPVEKTLELGEYRINYASLGEGQKKGTLIMLHSSDKRDDWRTWESLFSLASDGYTLIIPDMVGFGKSTTPVETPDYRSQARVLHEMMERLSIERGVLVGTSWGGQVALEVAIDWPAAVEALVLISSTYDKAQIPSLKKLNRPTLIIWAEDDLVAQLKAGYLLRDAIKTARLEVLPAAAKDPRYDFTIAHKLTRFKAESVIGLIRDFLRAPSEKVPSPPQMEAELLGLAMKEPDKEEEEEGESGQK